MEGKFLKKLMFLMFEEYKYSKEYAVKQIKDIDKNPLLVKFYTCMFSTFTIYKEYMEQIHKLDKASLMELTALLPIFKEAREYLGENFDRTQFYLVIGDTISALKPSKNTTDRFAKIHKVGHMLPWFMDNTEIYLEIIRVIKDKDSNEEGIDPIIQEGVFWAKKSKGASPEERKQIMEQFKQYVGSTCYTLSDEVDVKNLSIGQLAILNGRVKTGMERYGQEI